MPPILTGGLQVPSPRITPDRYGLLTVTDPLTPEDEHWEIGPVLWDDDLCSDIHSTLDYCPIPATGTVPRITDSDFEYCTADPFIIYASFDCPPVGRLGREAFTIARKRLEIREPRELERAFWSGLTEDDKEINPSLSNGNSTCNILPVDLTPAAGPLHPVAAIAVLESALGECSPGTGVIHGNYGLASFLAAHSLIYPRGDDALYTVTGQRLALGMGYPGTGPLNVAPDSGATFLFGTGPIVIFRSEVRLTPERFVEAMDTNLNSVQVYAERTYALGYSCCLFAIQVLLCP